MAGLAARTPEPLAWLQKELGQCSHMQKWDCCATICHIYLSICLSFSLLLHWFGVSSPKGALTPEPSPSNLHHTGTGTGTAAGTDGTVFTGASKRPFPGEVVQIPDVVLARCAAVREPNAPVPPHAPIVRKVVFVPQVPRKTPTPCPLRSRNISSIILSVGPWGHCPLGLWSALSTPCISTAMDGTCASQVWFPSAPHGHGTSTAKHCTALHIISMVKHCRAVCSIACVQPHCRTLAQQCMCIATHWKRIERIWTALPRHSAVLHERCVGPIFVCPPSPPPGFPSFSPTFPPSFHHNAGVLPKLWPGDLLCHWQAWRTCQQYQWARRSHVANHGFML